MSRKDPHAYVNFESFVTSPSSLDTCLRMQTCRYNSDCADRYKQARTSTPFESVLHAYRIINTLRLLKQHTNMTFSLNCNCFEVNLLSLGSKTSVKCAKLYCIFHGFGELAYFSHFFKLEEDGNVNQSRI